MKSGTIVTFYSYKGGVGRSFALANIAAVLYQWGYKVLCIDWDLEAPGLQHYFRKWLSRERGLGIVDLFQSFSETQHPRWKRYVTKTALKKGRGRIDIIPAGKGGDGYMQAVQDLDWAELYEKCGLGPFLESLRDDWKKEYDYVLIDSRTGVSDISGICTIQLPDLLAFFFCANDQSLEGSCDVATRSIESRSQLPFDRPRLITLPVLSRFEMRVEFKISSAWLRRIQKRLKDFYAPWIPTKTRAKNVIELTRISNVPYWSFGENIPILTDVHHNEDPESVNYSFRNIAALIAHNLADADQLVLSRESYLARSGFSAEPDLRTGTTEKPWIFISFTKLQGRLVATLKSHFQRAGYPVRTSGDLSSQKVKRDDLLRTLRDASIFVPIFSGPPSNWQHSEIETFVSTNVREQGLTRILPVIVSEGMLNYIPPILTSFQFIDGRKLSGRQLAQKLLQVIDQSVSAVRSPNQTELKFI